MFKVKRSFDLMFIVMVTVTVSGCIKPCQMDWARSCSEKQREVLKRDIEVNDYNKKNSSNSKKENVLN